MRFLDFLMEIQGRMVDALARESDEGRCVRAYFGEVVNNLRSGSFRMGKPNSINWNCSERKRGGQTRGSKTFQYPEEKKLKSIP